MKILCLVGPTGVGKTAVAIELCDLLNGEIVSADSMQIYRGLDIATAKPTSNEQALARHHLIDIRTPDEFCSAAQWAEEARAALQDIASRGKTPIVAGGTGFYIRALLQPEVLAGAPPNETLRAQLKKEVETHGALWLHQKLAAHDAAAAARLHPNDVFRVARALEVALSTGKGVRSNSTVLPSYDAKIFALTMPRERLYERLNLRIDAMLQNGFVEELRRVQIYDAALPSMQSVGYRQMRAALNEQAVWVESVELWKRETRRYAKRQMTWFRHQLDATWLDVSLFNDARAVAGKIAEVWNR